LSFLVQIHRPQISPTVATGLNYKQLNSFAFTQSFANGKGYEYM